MKFEQEFESFRPINITIETETELQELIDIIGSRANHLGKDVYQLMAFLVRVNQSL